MLLCLSSEDHMNVESALETFEYIQRMHKISANDLFIQSWFRVRTKTFYKIIN